MIDDDDDEAAGDRRVKVHERHVDGKAQQIIRAIGDDDGRRVGKWGFREIRVTQETLADGVV